MLREVILVPRGRINHIAQHFGTSTRAVSLYLRDYYDKMSSSYAKQEEVRRYAMNDCGGVVSKGI